MRPYNILINSEMIKKNKTIETIPGIFEFMPNVYDVLMELPFRIGKLCDDEDFEMVQIQDYFQLFVHDTSFKIRNIFNLMEIGSYSDACIIFRTLVESFIVYKYFILRKDGTGLSKYFAVNPLERSKVRIKDIFENVVPGYYDDLYSDLCMQTHGNPLIQAMFKGNVSKDTPIKSNINNINLDWFSYITNQLLPLIIGIINLYKYAYPDNTINEKEELVGKINIINEFINNDIEKRRTLFPKQIKMINYYNKMIEI